jgi:uncharacterized membrane protein
MVTSGYFNYFLAMAGAAAALTGLLFVAVSIQQERTFGSGAPLERRAVAATAFLSLLVPFFTATEALLPATNIGFGCVVLAVLALLATLRLGWQLVLYQFGPRARSRPLWLRLARVLALLAPAVVIYAYLLLTGRHLLDQPHDQAALGVVAVLLQAMCGLGLFRAWELLGASRQGLLGWLNPLLDLDEVPEPVGSRGTEAPAHRPTTA